MLREFTNAARDETAAAEAAGGDEADMEVEVEEMETGEGGQVADGLVSGVEQMGVDEAGSGGGASASAS